MLTSIQVDITQTGTTAVTVGPYALIGGNYEAAIVKNGGTLGTISIEQIASDGTSTIVMASGTASPFLENLYLPVGSYQVVLTGTSLVAIGGLSLALK